MSGEQILFIATIASLVSGYFILRWRAESEKK